MVNDMHTRRRRLVGACGVWVPVCYKATLLQKKPLLGPTFIGLILMKNCLTMEMLKSKLPLVVIVAG